MAKPGWRLWWEQKEAGRAGHVSSSQSDATMVSLKFSQQDEAMGITSAMFTSLGFYNLIPSFFQSCGVGEFLHVIYRGEEGGPENM